MLVLVAHVPAVCAGHLGDQVEPESAFARVAPHGGRRRGGRAEGGKPDAGGVVGQAGGGPRSSATVPQRVGRHLVELEDQLVAEVGVTRTVVLSGRDAAELGAYQGKLGDVLQLPGEHRPGDRWTCGGPARPRRVPTHPLFSSHLAAVRDGDRTLSYRPSGADINLVRRGSPSRG